MQQAYTPPWPACIVQRQKTALQSAVHRAHSTRHPKDNHAREHPLTPMTMPATKSYACIRAAGKYCPPCPPALYRRRAALQSDVHRAHIIPKNDHQDDTHSLTSTRGSQPKLHTTSMPHMPALKQLQEAYPPQPLA
eukprot:scaffold29492_cov18-Tisochrysis_lutea.AAC.1